MIYNFISYIKLNKNNNLEVSYRKCIICKYYYNFYLITTLHNLNNSIKNICKINKKNIILKIEESIKIPEIDLIIFNVNNYFPMENISCYDLYNSKYNIDDINENTYFYMYESNNNKINMKNININRGKYINLSFPDMLMYTIKNDTIYEIEGLSGSPIYYNNNKIIGIQSGNLDNLLIIIPFIFVKRIINELFNYKTFYGLCNFYFEIKNNIIISNYEIDYNIYIKSIDLKFSKLYKGDYILKLDDLEIRNNLIFCPNLKYYIDIHDYIILNKTIHDTNNFIIFRQSNKIKNKLIIKTGNKDMNKSLSINITENKIIKIIINNKIYFKINSELFFYIMNNNQNEIIDFIKLEKLFKNKFSNFFKNKYISNNSLINDFKINID